MAVVVKGTCKSLSEEERRALLVVFRFILHCVPKNLNINFLQVLRQRILVVASIDATVW